MQINKAIRKVMREREVSLLSMAKSLGKKRGNEISARLVCSNLSFDRAIEMLNVLGYECIIQPVGKAHDLDQIVVDQVEE